MVAARGVCVHYVAIHQRTAGLYRLQHQQQYSQQRPYEQAMSAGGPHCLQAEALYEHMQIQSVIPD